LWLGLPTQRELALWLNCSRILSSQRALGVRAPLLVVIQISVERRFPVPTTSVRKAPVRRTSLCRSRHLLIEPTPIALILDKRSGIALSERLMFSVFYPLELLLSAKYRPNSAIDGLRFLAAHRFMKGSI
jgi:hypothetical protein